MFPQFPATSATFSRTSALISRVGTDGQFYDEPEAPNLAVLLDSKYDAEKIEGMKRLIAFMSQGRDVSNFFPQVVKNVVSQSLEVKKLVYIYLVHFAEKRPDEALLAINTFQKDLSDLNALVRAWALRAMSGIRVRVVLPLVVMAVSKCARDPSPYVRRCSAHAIPKIFALDRDQYSETLEELVCFLLNDSSPGVIGAVAAAFIAVCPERLLLLKPQFTKLCGMLPNVDEWGQVVLIDILLRYAVGRHGFPKSSIGFSSLCASQSLQENFSPNGHLTLGTDDVQGLARTSTIQHDQISVQSANKNGYSGALASTDRWLREIPGVSSDNVVQSEVLTLLKCTESLLWSRNSAVVMAAVGVHWFLGSRDEVKKILKPLLFLLRSSIDAQFVVLANVASFVHVVPSLFEAYYEDFFVTSSDAQHVRAMKLDILCQIATEASIRSILQEFEAYVRDPDRQFAANTVSAIGRCAVRLPEIAAVCTQGLLMLVRGGSEFQSVQDCSEKDAESSKNERQRSYFMGHISQKPVDGANREAVVVTKAVLALRTIIQLHPAETDEVFAQLVRSLDQLKVHKARATVIWMVGELKEGNRIARMLPVVLRYLAGTFTRESDETKLQILNCVVKVVLRSHGSIDSASRTAFLVFRHVLKLASQDMNCDVRDRARMFQLLLASYLTVPSIEENLEPQGLAERLKTAELLGSSSDPASDPEGNILSLLNYPGDEVRASRMQFSFNDADNAFINERKVLLARCAEHILLRPKSAPIQHCLAPERFSFLPGSMSHVVLHKAPNYMPLPEPYSLDVWEQSSPESSSPGAQIANQNLDSGSMSEYVESGEDEKSCELSSAGSSGKDDSTEEEGREAHSSETSTSSSEKRVNLSRRGSSRMKNIKTRKNQLVTAQQVKIQSSSIRPLISLSEDEMPLDLDMAQGSNVVSGSHGAFSDLGLISATELDSWLGSPAQDVEESAPFSGKLTGYAALSLGIITVEPHRYLLLDPTSGGGLEVKYGTEEGHLSASYIQQIRIFFHNRGSKSCSGICLRLAEPNATSSESGPGTWLADCRKVDSGVAPLLEIPDLQPGDKTEGTLSLNLRDHVDRISLLVLCNGISHNVALFSEVGSLIRPFPMSSEAFLSAEKQITGIHESTCRCLIDLSSLPTFSRSTYTSSTEDLVLLVSHDIAHKVLSVAHLALISAIIPIVDLVIVEEDTKSSYLEGLQLCFSGKTLRDSLLCYVTIAVIPDSSVDRRTQLTVMMKLKCEDTFFGLSLLKVLSKVLSSSEPC